MRITRLLVLAAVLCGTGLLVAKEDQVLKDFLDDDKVAEYWIYDDIEAGLAEAKKTGKPLLFSFRCVP